jgi:hypothetical protein
VWLPLSRKTKHKVTSIYEEEDSAMFMSKSNRTGQFRAHKSLQNFSSKDSAVLKPR